VVSEDLLPGRVHLAAPDPETPQGLRVRAILSIGLQVGPRRAEIAALKVTYRETRRQMGVETIITF